MVFWQDLALKFFTFMASLIYAMIDFIIAEIIGLVIVKKSLFKKSEFFVFLTILMGIFIFYLSNLFQSIIILILEKLAWWLLLIFAIMLCINIFVLAKFSLERTWRFRLVVVPLVILAIILLGLLIYWGFTLSNQIHTGNISTNITRISK